MVLVDLNSAMTCGTPGANVEEASGLDIMLAFTKGYTS